MYRFLLINRLIRRTDCLLEETEGLKLSSSIGNLSRNLSTNVSKKSQEISTTDYSRTIFVPRSKFSPKHDPESELKIQEDRQFSQAYLEQNPARKPHVIHDGPPFANGPIHLGHAINKILKDIAARYAMITGHRVEFITGWDCHGLPIELQVLKLLEEQQTSASYGATMAQESANSPEHFRSKARTYAKSQIDLQMAAFKRIGLLTDWNKRYTTDDPSYVANQLRAFSRLYEQKLIFKDLMPVNWSLSNQTTLSDADIEYRTNHISKSAYVMYEIIDAPFSADTPGQPFYALVWTTTPWTLLENQAIAFNKQETYCLVKIWSNTSVTATKYLVLSNDSLHKAQELLQRLGYNYEVKTYLPGRSLIGLRYKPLFSDLISDDKGEPKEAEATSPLPFIEAEFVEGAKGTGLVHLAPNYGFEDFELFKKHKLKVGKSFVDRTGYFTDEAGKRLAKKHIFSDGSQEILALLDQYEALLFTESTRHSYPYETRTNQPIIIRSSPQVFLDTARVIPRCLKALESCSFYPENRRKQLINTLTSSPSWCISRQRLWGTPIPVFYDKQDEGKKNMIHHPKIVDHLCKLLYKKRFMDYWWTLDNSELIPQELLDECKLPFKSEDLVRGMDIFDVWSDSGLSWHTITDSIDDSKEQADLFLEGVDQIRGWFSASSILSMALRGCIPTKRFFVHGFALDHHGRKMSKSQGNVVDPAKLFERYGVDPIRIWAAKVAGSNKDVCVETKVFESSIDQTISKIRLTLKFLIGALDGFETTSADSKFEHTKLPLFDQYCLDKLYRLASDMDAHYRKYNFEEAVFTMMDFINTDLSPIYLNTIKDILYCDDFDSRRRISCLVVLENAYNILLRCLYPLVPHIVHEAIRFKSPRQPLNEWQDLGYKAAWKNDVLHDQFEILIKIKNVINHELGQKQFDMLKDHQGCLTLSDKKFYKHLIKVFESESDTVAQLFRVSSLTLKHNEKLTEPDNQVQKESSQATEAINHTAGDQSMNVDESFKLISSWYETNIQGIRAGGLISFKEAKQFKFEINYEKSKNRKCPRCRLFRISHEDEHANCCDRCKSAMQKLELLV